MLLSRLKEIRVLREDGSFNTRMGMSLSKNPKNKDVWKEIKEKTDFLEPDVPVSQRIHALVNDIRYPVTCPTCKNNSPKFVSFNQGYKVFCSPKCAQSNTDTRNKIKQTNLDKYGSEYPCGNAEIEQKRRKTCGTKYGASTPFESQEIQRKVRHIIEERYGVNSTALVPSISEKQKQTRLKNIGAEFPFQSNKIQEKVNQSHIDKFGHIRFSRGLLPTRTASLLDNRDWLQHQHVVLKKPLMQIGHELDVSDVTVGNYLRLYGVHTHHFSHSTGEKEILFFVQQLLPDTEIQENTQRIISPYELDIYIPEHKLAIEYCGLYWHSDKFKENYYHRNKMQACRAQNIRLLTIFEDEWRDKEDIVKAKIKNILGADDRPKVFARKTHIVGVDTKTKNEFLDQYHIQGTGPGSITYGLVCDTVLVAVMTFIKRSPITYELNRYATSCRVPGGFSKLLKHFQRNHVWTQIVSFADLRWSDGKLYENTGWTLDRILPPDYYWCKNGKRYHKFGFRHKHLPGKLVEYDCNLSENENCKNNGYTKIHNCGLLRFTFK